MQKEFQAPALLGADSGKDPAYSETTYPFSLFGWSPLHGLQNEHYHFIEAPKPELYDLASDPGETKNIADEKPAVVGVLQEKLQKLLGRSPFQETAGGKSTLTPDAQEKLRALGYFGFHAPVSPEALKHGLADPKDKLWEFNTIMKSEEAFQKNRGDEGESLLLQAQKKDPNIALVAFLLGEMALRQKNWDRAAHQLQRCLELNPEFDSAMTALARALFPLGRTGEAKTWLKKALEINPQNYTAWYLMGVFEPEDSAAAQADYKKAIAIQPGFLPAQRELGMALLHQKEYAAAAPHLEKAVALEPRDALLHNYLGMCYAKTQRAGQAVKEHQHAIELDPNLADAHMNLAYDYQQLGRMPEAKAEMDEACRLDPSMCQRIRSQQK